MTWPTPPLGSLVTTIVPARDKPQNLDGPIPWLRIEDFEGQYVGTSATDQGVTEETIASMNLKVFPTGTVICTCSCSIGTTAIASRPLITNQTFIGLLPRDGALNSRFLYWSLQGVRDRLNATATGAIQQYLSRDDFRQLRLPVPPPEMQHAIADYLDRETARIDALIDKKMRIMTLIGDRTEILLAKHLDELIERYGEVPLKSVAKLSVSNVDKKSYEGQTPVQLCNYTDVYYQRKISKEIVFMDATADFAQIQKLTLNKGDVLITKDSETADDIAVPALVVEDLPGVVLGYHLALLRPFGILGDFLYWVVLSRRCRDAFSLAASGVTRFGLRQDAIARVPVAAASLEEQKSLVKLLENSVSSSDLVVDLIQRQVALLKERRQALITAAVTGEIEIPEVAA